MDPTDCRFCSQSYATTYNRKRHEMQQHPDQTIKAETKKRRSSSPAKNSNSSTQSSETSDANSSSDSIESTGFDQNEVWVDLIKEACDDMSEKAMEEVESPQDLLSEPYITEFMEKLQDTVSYHIRRARHLEHENELCDKIQQTAEKYINSGEGYTKDEAFKKAWTERIVAIKGMLSEHTDAIEKHLNKDDT